MLSLGWCILLLSLIAMNRADELQLSAANEDLLFYYNGETHWATPCAVAITKTTAFFIQNPFEANQVITPVTLPAGTTAAGAIAQTDSHSTIGVWLGTAAPSGTISWAFSGDCKTVAPPSVTYNYPGVTWNQAVNWRPEIYPGETESGWIITAFAANNRFLEFEIDIVGNMLAPSPDGDFPLPSFTGAVHTVVGYGQGAPHTANTPYVAETLTRQISAQDSHTGELALIDPNSHGPIPAFRYFPNIRGWQAGIKQDLNAVGILFALALIDPEPGNTLGYILGFLPSLDQPKTIEYKFDNPLTDRWKAVSGGFVFQAGPSGLIAYTTIVTGTAKPGGDLALRTVVFDNGAGTLTLLPTPTIINQTNTSWIPDTPSFLATRTYLGDPDWIYFSAQRPAGPVIFRIPFTAPTASELSTLLKKTQAPSQYKEGFVDNSIGGAKDCDSQKLCRMLNTDPDCGSMCCNAIPPPPGSHHFSVICCSDCNCGNCVNNPGKCV
jgi:hypothetical protein